MSEPTEENDLGNAQKPELEPIQLHIDESSTKVKTVQNVALADATAKQKPSLWTRRMFQVFLPFTPL